MAELAGIFVSPLLQAFFERVASREFIDFFRGQKLDQALLEKLETALLSVNAVFEDAEEKQVANDNVKNWLDKLKDAIYEAEDILDEIDTEAMHCKLDAEFHSTTTSKVRKAISNSLKVPFVKKIEPKIKQVLDRLNDLLSQKKHMGLKEGVQGKPSERLPTTSLVEESGICGREDDKKEIINSLCPDDVSGNKLLVIAIVGMGGLGKTTLAQLVFNDESVNKHFDLRAWACVSDDFDVFKVTKAILEGVPGSSANGDGKTLNWLQNTLKESLTGKKFLLVLDDVWNDNATNWEALSTPFRFGAKGSRVLVTTRGKRVASVMKAEIYDLKSLPEKECWSLFVRHAFHGSISDMHPELEAIGRQIVKKCEGLPLAVKTIGALLSFNVDADNWNEKLKSELWDMSTEIIPALRLSYKYLPSHLKRCFAYCSIFPKDYFFAKEKLVLLWMAEGFLQKSKDKTMEQVGYDYASDLESRSLLFQQSNVYDENFATFGSGFGMHDLVNDLARFVSGQFIFRGEGDNLLQVSNKTRHLSIVETIPKSTFEVLYEAKGLRTFFPIYDGIFPLVSLPMLRFLRVLSFASNRNLTELPDSIGKIRHLRYLDLSGTLIRKLPDSICKLCNLQTLRLMWCQNLTVLPRDMHKLFSLRHLVLGSTAITGMPLHLGRLKCLQTLDKFVVNKHCGSSNIGELGKLEYIGGYLVIMKLQNVKSPADALDARLKDKKHLEDLRLDWDDTTSNISESDQITVLENLQPHTNLKSLHIYGYGGKNFPDWIAHHSFSKIEHLYLYNCKYCHILPSFGQLHALQSLYITGFHGIARVGIEFFGSGSSTFKPFEALKVLKFKDMPNWENWLCFDSKNEGEAFPCLEELKIVRCPKLTGGLPIHLPSLARLRIVECSQLEASLPRSPTLRQLELTNFNEVLLNELPSGLLQKVVLKGCAALRSLPEGMMDSSSPLQELEIDGCCSLMLLSDDGLPTTLETLMISNCKKLEFPVHFNYSSLKELYLENSCDSLRSLPDKMHLLLPSLESLSISECPMLQSFGEGGLPTNLKSISIQDCDKLVACRTTWGLQKLPSLQEVSIGGKCEDVESFPEPALLPMTLTSLTISRFPNMTSLDMKHLTFLENLYIRNLPRLKFTPEERLFNSISTLIHLSIREFPFMTSLDNLGLQHLTSLKTMQIFDCPDLEFLPKDGFPASISVLRIGNCPLLEKQLQNKKGKEWRKAAHIPDLMIH